MHQQQEQPNVTGEGQRLEAQVDRTGAQFGAPHLTVVGRQHLVVFSAEEGDGPGGAGFFKKHPVCQGGLVVAEFAAQWSHLIFSFIEGRCPDYPRKSHRQEGGEDSQHQHRFQRDEV